MVLWKLKECDPHSFDPSLPRNPLIMNSNFTLRGVVPSGCVKQITGLQACQFIVVEIVRWVSYFVTKLTVTFTLNIYVLVLQNKLKV